MDRIAIFIDGGYLNKVLQNEFSWARIAYDRLATRISGGKEILRTYYYNCPPYQGSKPTPDEKKRREVTNSFFTSLSRLPRFEVRLGKLAFRGMDNDGRPIFQQKRVDIMFGVDLVSMAATKQISHAAIVSGDSDFVPAVVAAKTHGVLIALWHGSMNSTHQELWDECDDRYQITQEFIDSIKK